MSLEYKILGQNPGASTAISGKFVVAESFDANSTLAIYSTDGITWTETTMPTPESNDFWRLSAYGEGVFVAVGSDNTNTGTSIKAAYSTDAITWTETSMPTLAAWKYIVYGDGKFVAISNGSSAAYSTDGITWTASTMPRSTFWGQGTYGNGKFLALSSGSNGTHLVAYSTDAITWTEVTLPAPSSSWYFGIAYGDGKFVVTAGGYSAAYSTDAITWTAVSTLPTWEYWGPVTYGNGRFVALNSFNSTGAAYSTDAITWTQATLPVSATWASLIHGDGKFVAAASNTTTGAYSTDGATWTQTTLPASANWLFGAYGEKTELVSSIQYTTPSTKQAIISSLFIANNTESSQTYSVAVVPDGETLSSIHYIRKNVTIDANDFNTIETKITLSEGDQIITESSSTDVTINIFGVEK